MKTVEGPILNTLVISLNTTTTTTAAPAPAPLPLPRPRPPPPATTTTRSFLVQFTYVKRIRLSKIKSKSNNS